MALITRMQISLPPGITAVPHLLTDVVFPEWIMVEPLPPTIGWSFVEPVGQPTKTTVSLENTGGGTVIVNVVFRYVHTVVGVDEAEAYA